MPRSFLPFLLAFILLRLVFWFATFPNPDEAYYWLWGQHPALSYYDHPPLEAWLQGLFTAVLGRSTFVLRLPNLLSNAILFYTYYQIIRYLYSEKRQQSFG
jgi:4-amino-4-deoxy-L-arabinose transferase-like glycosyltransferase